MSGSGWMMGGRPLPRQDGHFDVMQVCLSGHRVTSMAQSMPGVCEDFCRKCGAETIISCPACSTPIRGFYHSAAGLISSADTPVPNNCHACGGAYPWRSAKLDAAKEALEFALHGEEATTALALLSDISAETPRTHLAALKLGRLLSAIKDPAMEVVKKTLTDIVVASAKAHLGL